MKGSGLVTVNWASTDPLSRALEKAVVEIGDEGVGIGHGQLGFHRSVVESLGKGVVGHEGETLREAMLQRELEGVVVGDAAVGQLDHGSVGRSEERRVGKEWRSR